MLLVSHWLWPLLLIASIAYDLFRFIHSKHSRLHMESIFRFDCLSISLSFVDTCLICCFFVFLFIFERNDWYLIHSYIVVDELYVFWLVIKAWWWQNTLYEIRIRQSDLNSNSNSNCVLGFFFLPFLLLIIYSLHLSRWFECILHKNLMHWRKKKTTYITATSPTELLMMVQSFFLILLLRIFLQFFISYSKNWMH